MSSEELGMNIRISRLGLFPVVGVSFFALLLPLAVVSSAAAGGKNGEGKDPSQSTSYCRSILNAFNGIGLDRTRIFSDKIIRINSWEVPFVQQNWIATHPSNQVLTIRFHSSGWLIPRTVEEIPKSIDLFVQQAVDNKDPGGTVRKQQLSHYGWSESTVRWRLGTSLCLYSIANDTQKKKLLPAIENLLLAAKDPRRYYGPPQSRPHNHGVMSDRELLDASVVLKRPSLAEFAKTRLKSQMASMYDNCGFMREQSNGYQHFHAGLWGQILRRIVNDPNFREYIRKQIVKIAYAAYAVTYPDGLTPVIGDGVRKQVNDLGKVSKNLNLFCKQTGWYSWRDSTGPRTQHIIARFGPRTSLHGHADKGGVVWWVGSGSSGEQVLADRGLSGKNRDSAYAYSTGPKAHAVLLWPGGSNLSLAGFLDKKTDGNVLQLTGTTGGSTWTRRVQTSNTGLVLKIEDRITGVASEKPATQNLPLDPVWKPAGKKPGVFTSEQGRTLKISCVKINGKRLNVTSRKMADYQETGTVRTGYTATCKVDRASEGIKTVLTVS